MNGWPDDDCPYCADPTCRRPDVCGSDLDSDGGRRFDKEIKMKPETDLAFNAFFAGIWLQWAVRDIADGPGVWALVSTALFALDVWMAVAAWRRIRSARLAAS